MSGLIKHEGRCNMPSTFSYVNILDSEILNVFL